MDVNVSNAIKLFFSNTSLEMVYFEAIANAIDANATKIDISIKIESYSSPETLTVTIKDNGNGFTDKNFAKFSKLLEIEEESHKGIGRLVFLNYFKKVDIQSTYDNKKRTFLFNNAFKGDNKLTDVLSKENETILVFNNYLLERIKSYDYLKPAAILKSIQLHFFPLLYSLKIREIDLKISVKLETKESNLQYDFFSDTKTFSVKNLPTIRLCFF